MMGAVVRTMRATMSVSILARRRLAAATLFCVVCAGTSVTPWLNDRLAAQGPPSQPERQPFFGPPPPPSPVERLGPNLLRIGAIRIDTAKRELSVAGFVNDVRVLEFLANTKGGFKAYESALELDTNAINFNVACILLGLDNSHAVPARFQFDPTGPKGDPVEIFVEWNEGDALRRVKAEQLVYSRATKTTLPEGSWIYTGSSFVQQSNMFLAETDGTLIGFMHNPSPIIDNSLLLASQYGDSMINPDLHLKPGSSVRLTLRAIPLP